MLIQNAIIFLFFVLTWIISQIFPIVGNSII